MATSDATDEALECNDQPSLHVNITSKESKSTDGSMQPATEYVIEATANNSSDSVGDDSKGINENNSVEVTSKESEIRDYVMESTSKKSSDSVDNHNNGIEENASVEVNCEESEVPHYVIEPTANKSSDSVDNNNNGIEEKASVNVSSKDCEGLDYVIEPTANKSSDSVDNNNNGIEENASVNVSSKDSEGLDYVIEPTANKSSDSVQDDNDGSKQSRSGDFTCKESEAAEGLVQLTTNRAWQSDDDRNASANEKWRNSFISVTNDEELDNKSDTSNSLVSVGVYPTFLFPNRVFHVHNWLDGPIEDSRELALESLRCDSVESVDSNFNLQMDMTEDEELKLQLSLSHSQESFLCKFSPLHSPVSQSSPARIGRSLKSDTEYPHDNGTGHNIDSISGNCALHKATCRQEQQCTEDLSKNGTETDTLAQNINEDTCEEQSKSNVESVAIKTEGNVHDENNVTPSTSQPDNIKPSTSETEDPKIHLVSFDEDEANNEVNVQLGWVERTNIINVSGFHLQDVETLQSMLLTGVGCSNDSVKDTMLMLGRRTMDTPANASSFFIAVSDQLTAHPTSSGVFTPEALRFYLHKTFVDKREIIENAFHSYLLDYQLTYDQYIAGLLFTENPPDILAMYLTALMLDIPMTIMTNLNSWNYKGSSRLADPMQLELTIIYNGSYLFTSTRRLVYDVLNALSLPEKTYVLQTMMINQSQGGLQQSSSQEFVEKKVKKRKPKPVDKPLSSTDSSTTDVQVANNPSKNKKGHNGKVKSSQKTTVEPGVSDKNSDVVFVHDTKPQTTHKCNICNQTFHTKVKLARHVMLHRLITDEDCTMCIECNKVYKTVYGFHTHILAKHNKFRSGADFANPLLEREIQSDEAASNHENNMEPYSVGARETNSEINVSQDNTQKGTVIIGNSSEGQEDNTTPTENCKPADDSDKHPPKESFPVISTDSNDKDSEDVNESLPSNNIPNPGVSDLTENKVQEVNESFASKEITNDTALDSTPSNVEEVNESFPSKEIANDSALDSTPSNVEEVNESFPSKDITTQNAGDSTGSKVEVANESLSSRDMPNESLGDSTQSNVEEVKETSTANNTQDKESGSESDTFVPQESIGRNLRKRKAVHIVPDEEVTEVKEKKKKVIDPDDWENRKVKCHICKREYQGMPAFDKHVVTYHKSRLKGFIACGVCKKRFSTSKGLIAHFDSHLTKVLPNKDIASKKPTKGHKENPPTKGTKPDKDIASKKPTKDTSLKNNPSKGDNDTDKVDNNPNVQPSRMHLRGQPICIICKKICMTKDELSNHLKDYHSKEKERLRCKICRKDFNTIKALNNHRNSDHRKNICPHCQVDKGTKRALTVHINTDHPIGGNVVKDEFETSDKPADKPTDFHCDMCGSRFATKAEIMDHMQSHVTSESDPKIADAMNESKEWSTCILCKRNFENQIQLTEHILTDHKKKKTKHVLDKESVKSVKVEKPDLICPYCSKTFDSGQKYSRHLKSHKKKVPAARKSTRILKTATKKHGTYCLTCQKNFATKAKLDDHYKKVHGSQVRYQCEKCEKSFSTKYTLQYHVKTEHDGYRYVCSYKNCKEGFKRKDALQAHEMEHKGEAKYICNICSKGFFHKSHFQGHLNSHSGNKPYKCPKCDKGFFYKGDVTKHLDICGLNDLPFKCNIGKCRGDDRRRFATEAYLRNHEVGYHRLGDPIVCNKCGFTTYYQSTFDNHMQTHK